MMKAKDGGKQMNKTSSDQKRSKEIVLTDVQNKENCLYSDKKSYWVLQVNETPCTYIIERN